MLKGTRIGLRPLQTEDIWLLYRWLNDARVIEDLGVRHPYFCTSMDEMRGTVTKKVSAPNERNFVIQHLEQGSAIGIADLLDIDERRASAEILVIIGEREHWSRGYCKEATTLLLDQAFGEMNLHRVYANVPEYNRRAIRCYEKCGLKKEGLQREDHFHMGSHMSTVVMSILRQEHQAVKG